jgi:hypothetical protein
MNTNNKVILQHFSKNGPDNITQRHSITVTVKHVCYANQLHSRKYPYFQWYSPASKNVPLLNFNFPPPPPIPT